MGGWVEEREASPVSTGGRVGGWVGEWTIYLLDLLRELHIPFAHGGQLPFVFHLSGGPDGLLAFLFFLHPV